MKKIFVILIFALISTSVNAFTLEFTEAQLQEKIEAMMPIKKKKLFVTVIISNPVIRLLKESNRLAVKADISADALGASKGTGKIEITGSLLYNAKKGTFHLKNPKIESMYIDDVPDMYQAKIKNLAQSAIIKTMAARPVYKLKEDNLKQKLAKASLKSILVNDGKLIIEFGLF